jgi:hypothetical protein
MLLRTVFVQQTTTVKQSCPALLVEVYTLPGLGRANANRSQETYGQRNGTSAGSLELRTYDKVMAGEYCAASMQY